MTLSHSRRPAYTLLELMVVVALIIVLATLTVAVANSSLVDSYKVVGGADRVSGWLLQAKQRALRDKTPVGLRLIRGSTNPADPEYYFCRQAQIVELPTLYAPNQDPSLNSLPPGAPFVAIRYVNLTVPTGIPANPTADAFTQENAAAEAGVYMYWPNNVSPYPALTIGTDLQVGDLLRVNELGSVHKISAITAVAAPSWFPTPLPAGQVLKLTLALSSVRLPTGQQFPSSPPYPTNLLPVNSVTLPAAASTQIYPTGYPPLSGANFYQSFYFGLFRSSRPILGEPLLQMPTNMAIDVNPYQDLGTAGLSAGDILPLSINIPSSTTGELEIVFNPNGTVLFSNDGLIALWLRDTRNGGGQLPMLVTAVNSPAAGDVQVDRARLMNAGEHVLVSVYTKTGAIATYPIYPPDQAGIYYRATDGGTAGPYKYALKATNTGL